MKRSLTWLAGFLFLIAVPCFGADTATVTLLFGQPKLLRGTTWFTLKEGVRLRDGDVIDLPASGQLQLEFTDSGAVSVIGPGALYIAAASARDAKQSGSAEFQLTRGWLKFVTKSPGPRLRVRTALGTIAASEATAVVHAADGFEAFVETGTAKLSDVGKIELTGGEIKAGGFASRSAGKPLTTERRPPAAFVGALPRDFMDPLPVRADRFASAHVDPVADHEATFAEAQALPGETRRSGLPRCDGDQWQGAARMERCSAAAQGGNAAAGAGRQGGARAEIPLAVGKIDRTGGHT
jgi:hypothetical protein